MNTDFLSLAKEKQKVRDYSAAYAYFLKALEQDPYNPDILSEIGVVLFNLDRKTESLQFLDRAANLEPNNSYRYSSRGFVKASMGDVQGGIEDYKKCIELDPEDAVAYNNLGMLEEQLGYKENANKSFKKADELSQILFENNITLSKDEEEITPTPITENQDKEQSTFLAVFKQVFTSKAMFSEFVGFIKNGFKLNK
jgi:tetratricopeptide (TPR) repeat protein